MNTPKSTPEEICEKAKNLSERIDKASNIHIPGNTELKRELLAELKKVIKDSTRKKIEGALNHSILLIGKVENATLAGCYAHCIRNVVFMQNDFLKRAEKASRTLDMNNNEILEVTKEIRPYAKITSKNIEGKFIFKDCFGQPIERLWYRDDPRYYKGGSLLGGVNEAFYFESTGIKNWMDFCTGGATLFLTRLEGKDSIECKEFAKRTESLNTSFCGKLIVHANNETDLPDCFFNQFEVIYLETRILLNPKTNSIIVNGKTFQTKDESDYLIFKLLYDNQDRYVSKGDFITKGYAKDENDLFKRITGLRELFERCPLKIHNKKQTENKEGGYRLIIE